MPGWGWKAGLKKPKGEVVRDALLEEVTYQLRLAGVSHAKEEVGATMGNTCAKAQRCGRNTV